MRGTTITVHKKNLFRYFNPRAPCGARHRPNDCGAWSSHFNPRAPCGARRFRAAKRSKIFPFQSTCPMRGTTRCVMHLPSYKRYFNPRAPCGARPDDLVATRRLSYFNPRAPCGARRIQLRQPSDGCQFQSTCPMRGTTDWIDVCLLVKLFQSTCPMRGTTSFRTTRTGTRYFNPRAPCGARQRSIWVSTYQ